MVRRRRSNVRSNVKRSRKRSNVKRSRRRSTVKPQRAKRSRRRSTTKAGKGSLNKFFNKIFVISLFDNSKKWNKVYKQFNSRGIKVERFVALDGRCKGNINDCLDKKKSFELSYNVTIENPTFKMKSFKDLKSLIPASSLTIGTVLLLRAQVRNKWEHMMICEDDIVLGRDLEEKFKQGIKYLPKDWDILYLGCGDLCGSVGVSYDKSKSNKHLSSLSSFINDDFYVSHKDDLRRPCDPKDCVKIGPNLTKAFEPGGSWCYAYSLNGAKKLLKLVGNNLGEHIDTIIKDNVIEGYLKAYAFDPPIVMHEDGAIRPNTNIPWEW